MSTSTPSTTDRSLCELTLPELEAWCVERKQPRFRAAQIRQWLFEKRAVDFDQMHNLPKSLRSELAAEFRILVARQLDHRIATDRTEKLLLELADGETVEAVLMREDDRRTVCISTQVGCGMGCVFCASGMRGLKRNLTTAEILEQVLALDRLLPDDERITNVVVMGIGEPLANLPALLPALEVLNDSGGFGLGARRMTVSTVGLPDRMREFAGVGKAFNLAVSLHAPNDALRNEIVPVNTGTGIREILEAADDYFEVTGRRVTYEYVLLGEFNDRPTHARQLAALLRSRNAHVNLIPMNPVSELSYRGPSRGRLERFVEILEKEGVPVTVRKRKGADVDAACGQLRLQRLERRTV